MEQQEERKWHLVRNSNGEWISNDNVVYLDGLSSTIYKSRAAFYGLPLSSQRDLEGDTWYYKHELETVIAAMDAHKQEVELRNLKLKPKERKPSEKEINDMVKNMVKHKTNKFAALSQDNKLWEVLDKKNNPPQWWKNILKDKDLYVEIRKDNYLNVYYYGGNVALIKCKRNGEIIAETHQKYLGDTKPARTRIITKKKENGKIEHKEVKVYENRSCMDKLQSKEGLEEIKRRVDEIYLDIHGKNKHGITKKNRDTDNKIYISSEKKVQGELKLKYPDLYVDSEFAYQKKDKETTRIDLVELRGKELVFVELKLITDSRMTDINKDKKEVEIIAQMKDYIEFINRHAQDIKGYYETLLKIKKKIGLWDRSTEIDSISLIPELLIVNTYHEGTYEGETGKKNKKDRKGRIDNIKNILDREGITYKIKGYKEL